jgi:hypothetical protein
MEENRQFTDKFMLRMPDGMRDRIKAKAEQNGVSMNAEIIHALHRYFPAPQDVGDILNDLAQNLSFVEPELRKKVIDSLSDEKARNWLSDWSDAINASDKDYGHVHPWEE